MNDLMNIELKLEELTDIFDISNSACDLLEKISIEGVCQNDIKIINNLLELKENSDYPIKSYTLDKSSINIEIAQESIINALVKGFQRMLELILNSISNFFSKLGEAIGKLTEKTKKQKTERKERRTDTVIKAIQNNSDVIVADNEKVDNKINEKKATGVIVEKLLNIAYEDETDFVYKTIEEIMNDYFGEKLTEEKWKSYIRSNDTKLKNVADYAISWWNITHPIVATEGNKSHDFIVANVEIINFVVEKIVYRLNWWINRINELSELELENLSSAINAMLNERDKEILNLNDQIRLRLESMFKPLNFMNVRIGTEPLVSIKTALDTFKQAKVESKSNLTFYESLDSLKWVSGIDNLQDKINEGNKQLEQSKRESKKIIDQIRKKQKNMSRALSAKIGKFINQMQTESQNLIMVTALLLSFVNFIEKKVNDNRNRIADLYLAMVYMGIDIGKHLEEPD